MATGEIPSEGMGRPLSGGPVKFGPYLLESRLAVGGTAEVFMARPLDPSAEPQKLIVKRLLPHFVADPEGRTMFEREAALHALVHHENVVRVYASGSVGSEPWLAMEFVDGCDLYRLLRRLSGHARKLGVGVATHVAREVLAALASVHSAHDPSGHPAGIVHGDVTPSNVYLSVQGRAKLGDFGIARAMNRAPRRPSGGELLKGKFAYLSPEQVAGEPFDHRADLFSVASVLAEMLLGKPLFGGSGQLAVLLAIRDCRIDELVEARSQLPDGLFAVLERSLSREPSQRYRTAEALSRELEPFDGGAVHSRSEIGALVRWVQSAPSVEQIRSVRQSAGKIRAAISARHSSAVDEEKPTGEYAPIPSFVVTRSGARFGPWSFARLVEAIATGEIGRGDRVEYMGRPASEVELIEDLCRFLPPQSVTTNRLAGLGAPDFADQMTFQALLSILFHVLETDATGVLFAEGPPEPGRSTRSDRSSASESGRKELYFLQGRLHHVASNNASELLGQYLVRHGTISREELDFSLAVLPRYGGRMGETLVSLGLVSSLDVFRAIRDQGRDRIVGLFRWTAGKLAFFAGQTSPHVEFPLDFELIPLIFSGMEAAEPDEIPMQTWGPQLDTVIGRATVRRPALERGRWPEIAHRILDLASRPKSVRELLQSMAQSDPSITANDVLRALDILLVGRMLTRLPPTG